MRWLACITFIGLVATPTLHAQSEAGRVFERLDQDGNGVLDRDEFQRAPVNQRNPNRFDQLDTDADGVVSREEAARFRAVMQEGTVEAAVAGKAGTKTLRWEIDGEERTALIRIPERAEGERSPLVFVWHGHGGRSTGAARTFGMHEHWPEAIVIYPQGLPTPGKLTDPEGRRSGWQTKDPAADNRDLRFFDVMYEDLLEQGIVDPELVYSTGHSNGGGFTYTLLFERGDRLAAIAPSSSAAGSRNRGRTFPKIPIFHLAGRKDGLVKMQWQQATIDHLRRLFDCGDPKPWGGHPDCRVHPSPEGDLLVTYVHGGGHKMPDDAGALFARFFREHARSVRAEREKKIDATNLEPGRSGDQAQSSPR